MNDFEKRLSAIPDVEPDKIDKAMIQTAQEGQDDDLINLDDFKKLMDYSGKISLRIPRSLHKELADAARVEGVSLNQYALYRLSHSTRN